VGTQGDADRKIEQKMKMQKEERETIAIFSAAAVFLALWNAFDVDLAFSIAGGAVTYAIIRIIVNYI